MARKLESSAHSKHLIMYHLIFVVKYRRKIFSFHDFGDALKQTFLDISSNYDFSIDTVAKYLEGQGRNGC